jgi:predicted nuclease of predicted toxin-antitoxin system
MPDDDTLRFLADMGVSWKVVEWLRSEGYDAIHLREEQLERLSDPDVFTKAGSERRVILTFDLDFSEIASLSGDPKVSVIVFRLRNTRTPHVIERLSSALTDASDALKTGAVVVVEDARQLPRFTNLICQPQRCAGLRVERVLAVS